MLFMQRKKIKVQSKNKVSRFIQRNIKNKTLQGVLILVLGLGVYGYNEIYLNNLSSAIDTDTKYKKISCVDGDTFKLDKVTMRMLVIDTPESVKPNHPIEPFGLEASSFTCDALTKAKEIRIQQDKGNEKDHYGRELVWVFVDDTLLQERLLEEGLAEIKFVQEQSIDKKYYTALKKAQKIAQAQKLGIWSLD